MASAILGAGAMECVARRPRAALAVAGLGLLLGMRALRRSLAGRFRQVPGWPLVGVLPQVDGGKRLAQCMEKWASELGQEGAYEFSLMGTRYVVVCDWELGKQVFGQRPLNVTRNEAFEHVMPPLVGDGAFSAEGEKWKRHRKITSPAFNSTAVRGYFPAVRETVGLLVELLEAGAADGAPPTNFSRLLPLLSMEVVVKVVFGQESGALRHGQSVVTDLLFEVFAAIQERYLAPVPYWLLPGASLVGLGAGSGAAPRLKEEIRRLLAGIPEGDTSCLVTRLAEAEGDKLSRQEVEGNLSQFLLAASETTSSALAFAFHHLSLQPELQQQVAAEVAEKAPGGVQSQDQLASLKLVKAVWMETLRLRSPGPMLALSTAVPIEIAGRTVAAGVNIFVLTRYIQNHTPEAKVLGEDLGEFRPSRWLSANERFVEFATLDTIAFGHGVRKCPGQRLAEDEGVLVIAEVLRRFQLEKGADSLAEISAFAQSPAEDVVLKLSRRTAEAGARGRA
ncbi:unnamed protein product [Polarella glacialis]|uniref:Cytochrome P450 n=1 Tax=Polarella glacialis TaxID=89957 RepID=A0A813FKF2_POLGL|nr:unnamed protein product [Polarella glacialis]CAE8612943.1 unnamed protein product [Polarella glacialis]